MARIRTIKPQFATSAGVGRLSRDARLFFLQLLCFVDDDGRCRYIKRKLAGDLFPYDHDVDEEVIAGWVAACEAEDMVRVYTIEGDPYLAITNFGRHQRISRKTDSLLPPPPHTPTVYERSLQVNTHRTEDSMSDGGCFSAKAPREWKGKEVERKEGDGELERLGHDKVEESSTLIPPLPTKPAHLLSSRNAEPSDSELLALTTRLKEARRGA